MGKQQERTSRLVGPLAGRWREIAFKPIPALWRPHNLPACRSRQAVVERESQHSSFALLSGLIHGADERCGFGEPLRLCAGKRLSFVVIMPRYWLPAHAAVAQW